MAARDPETAGGRDARVVPFGPTRSRTPTPTDDGELVAILRRCAAGDRSGLTDLRAWRGGRIGQTYVRLVKDPELAEAGLDDVFAELYREAGRYDPARGPAEDWVFGRLRRRVLLGSVAGTTGPLTRPARGGRATESLTPPRLSPAETEPAQAEAEPEGRPLISTPEHPSKPDVEASDLTAVSATERRLGETATEQAGPQEDTTRVASRRRRPSIPRMAGDDGPEETSDPASTRRGGRPLRRVLVWLTLVVVIAGAAAAAGLLGLPGNRPGLDAVLSTLHVPGLAPAPQPGAAGETAPAAGPVRVDSVTPTSPPQEAAPAAGRAAIGRPAGVPTTARPAPAELATPPLASPTPPVFARPLPPPAVDVAPSAARQEPVSGPSAAGGGIRVFIHHTASDRTSAALAAQLSDQLRRDGYPAVVTRPVRFRVTAPGVRYFFPADREAAGRLLRASARFVAPRTGQAPTNPGDFTHVEPKPRVGTLEIWLPSGG